jgi:hypothetical protein
MTTTTFFTGCGGHCLLYSSAAGTRPALLLVGFLLARRPPSMVRPPPKERGGGGGGSVAAGRWQRWCGGSQRPVCGAEVLCAFAFYLFSKLFVESHMYSRHTFVMSLNFDSRQRGICRERVGREYFAEGNSWQTVCRELTGLCRENRAHGKPRFPVWVWRWGWGWCVFGGRRGVKARFQTARAGSPVVCGQDMSPD